MEYIAKFYPETKFGGYTDIDGTMIFYMRVNSLISPTSVILDIGCGRGSCTEDSLLIRRNLRNLKGKCNKIIGIDVDKIGHNNPYLDEFRLIESNRWPIENESIDVCICDNVLEHIENPDLFFLELHRVVKQNGVVCIRTPNLLGYVGLIAKIIPNKYHEKILRKVQKGRPEEDVFPTYYQCNTKKKLAHMLRTYGFDSFVYGYESEPSYLSFSYLFYLLGVIHQRFVP